MPTDPVALQILHAELERLHERCSQELLRRTELQSALTNIDTPLKAALPQDSDLARVLDRRSREHTDWWQETSSGYVASEDCRNVGRRIATVREILVLLAPEFLRDEQFQQAQYYFQAGEIFRARQRFFHVLARARRRVDICDPYLDATVLDFVDALEPEVAVRLLSSKSGPLFRQQLVSLLEIRPNVELRLDRSSHDRWIVLDEGEVWHLGASINGLGKKAFMMSRIIDQTEAAKVIADFGAWWDKAPVEAA